MFILMLFTSISLAGDHQSAMDQIYFEQVSKREVLVMSHTLQVNYFGSGSDEEFAVKNIKNATRKVFEILSRDGIHPARCEYKKIDLYDINYDVLNDRSLMTFIEFDKPIKIDGLYDSRYSRAGHASVFVSNDIRIEKRSETIYHEIAHYWHDALCLDSVSNAMESEEFALRIEKFSQNSS
jgi:hypothetical protein